jgi:hypothetical protein
MWRSPHARFFAIVLSVVGLNYLAQIPYYLHLYYPRPPSLLGTLALGATFAWFAVGFVLLVRGARTGYWLLLSFLVAMVGFYLYNVMNQIVHGINTLFFLRDHDPLVGVVLAIGHVNLLAGIYFLWFLVTRYRAFVLRRSPPHLEVGNASPHLVGSDADLR